MKSEPVVSAHDLTKTYQRGREEVRALEGVSFTIERGQFVAVTGPSGAGKTTLLNLIGCMDAPTRGTLKIGDRMAHELSEGERTRLRRTHIGFVFQHFSLLPTLTVAENVALPALFARRATGDRVDKLLETVGLAPRRAHLPHALSGGEMQRAAIARALINGPSLLLADEPTGNLDSATGEAIIALFKKLQGEGLSIIVVTHNPALANTADRRLELRDGKLVV
jgi:putative ABC transport system ATP-binding protein